MSLVDKNGLPVVEENPDIIVFGDISGSVSGSNPYFNACREIYDKLVRENSRKNIHFFVWGSKTTRKSSTEFSDWIDSRKGNEGTYPICIVPEIPVNFTGRILLITDGEIADSDARQCVDAMALRFRIGEHRFEEVDIYLIETGSHINYSVVAAFSKFGEVNTHEYPRSGNKSITRENTYDIITVLSNVSQVEDINVSLADSIRKLVMGVNKTNLNLPFFVEIKSILMKLIFQFTPKSSSTNIQKFTDCTSSEMIDYDQLLEIVKEINAEFYGMKTSALSNQIKILHQCLSYLNNGISDFSKTSSLRTDASGNLIGFTVDLSTAISPSEINEDDIESSSLLVEDSITCDETLAQVLIRKPEVPFIPADSSNLTGLKKFPLNLRLPGFQDLLLPSIGSAGTELIARASGGNTFLHPTANVEVFSKGFIVAPLDANSELFRKIVQLNDLTAMRVIFGTNKKIGNTCLFSLNVLLELLQSESEFIKIHFDSFLLEVKWRMQNCILSATMCGPSTEFVSDKMPLKDAILFTLLSAVASTDPKRNPYFQHHQYYDKLINFLAACGIELPDHVTFHLNTLNFAMKILQMNKKVQGKERNKLLDLFNLIGKKFIIKQNGDLIPTADVFDITILNLSENDSNPDFDDLDILKHISIIEKELEKLFGICIKMSLFSNIFRLFNGSLLMIPHIPYGFDHTNSVIANCTKFDLTSFEFAKLLCEILSSLNKESLQDPTSQSICLPSVDDVCIYCFEKNDSKLISPIELSNFFKTGLNTSDKIREYIESNKVPVYSKSQTIGLLYNFKTYLVNRGLISDHYVCIGRPKGRNRMSHKKWNQWGYQFSNWKLHGCPTS